MNEKAAEKDLQDEVAQLKARLAEVEQERDGLLQKGSGWLITAANPAYDGTVAGILFSNGQAFIGVNQVVPAFDMAPAKETALEKYSEAERKAIREREAMSSAERAVRTLEADFGYKVEFFGPERQKDMAQRVSERNRQRLALDETLVNQKRQEKFLKG